MGINRKALVKIVEWDWGLTTEQPIDTKRP